MSIDYFKIKTSPYRNSYSYTALGTPFVNDESGHTRRPMANIDVEHQPAQFSIPHQEDDIDSETGLSTTYLGKLTHSLWVKDPHNMTADDVEAYEFLNSEIPDKEDREWVINNNPHFNPTKLFTVDRPSSIYVSGMFSDPSMTGSAMTLGAIAKRDLKADEIIASDSLSTYSSKLAQNAIKRGLPVKASEYNPGADVTNDIKMEEQSVPEDYPSHAGLSPISPGMVAASRKDMREMLATGREKKRRKAPAKKAVAKRNAQPVTPKGLSDQFIIPGMEGYV